MFNRIQPFSLYQCQHFSPYLFSWYNPAKITFLFHIGVKITTIKKKQARNLKFCLDSNSTLFFFFFVGVSIDGSGEIGSGFVGQARDGLESISGLDLSSDGATEGYNTVDGSAEGDISSGEKTSDSLSDTAEDVKSTEEDKTIEDSLESFTESIPEETVDRSAESTIGATTEDKVDASAETPVDTSAEGLVDTGIEGIDASAEGILDTVEDRLDASAEGAIDSSGEAMLEVSEEKDTEASAEAVIDESREEKIDASAERIDSSAEGINSSAEGIDSSAEVEIVALESEDLIEGSGSDTGNISNLESGNDVDDSGSGEEVSSGFVLVPESEEATDEEIGDLKENGKIISLMGMLCVIFELHT